MITGCGIVAEMTDNPDYNFAHEAPVYIPWNNSLLFASNRIGNGSEQVIELWLKDLSSDRPPERLPRKTWAEDIVMSNGAFLDYVPGKECPTTARSVLIISQGNLNKSSGVYRLHLDTLAVDVVLNVSGWDSSQFNSPNDIVVDPVSGAILFTDPMYGFWQKFRPEPRLGNYLWMYNPGAENEPMHPEKTRLLSDGFHRPNGLAFASDAGDLLYVTDTGYFRGGDFISEYKLVEYYKTRHNTSDLSRLVSAIQPEAPRTVYAFDVERNARREIVGLVNRRVLFVVEAGVPDGIKVDCEGRIYVGVGNGVAVYSREGAVLGTFFAPSGCANLVLVPRGKQAMDIVALCEKQIFKFSVATGSCQYGKRWSGLGR